jgi:hypothetical protein
MVYIIKQCKQEECNSIAQKVADGEAPPRKEPADGDGGWLRLREVGIFKGTEQMEREAQHQAARSRGAEGCRQAARPLKRGTLRRMR